MKNCLSRFLRGTVTARVASGSAPRFYTAAMRERQGFLWVRGQAFCVPARQYKGLHRIARRSGCTLRVTARRGLLFELRRRLLLLPLLALLAGFAAGCLFFSTRLLAFEIPAVSFASRGELRRFAVQNGWSFGMARRDFDGQRLANRLAIAYPGFAFTAVNSYPGFAELVAVERQPQPAGKTGQPGVLVSDYDAVITEVSVPGGRPTVRPGQSVARGELLAGGGVTANPASWAAGEVGTVRGLVLLELGFYLPSETETLLPTGRRAEQSYLLAGRFSLPLGWSRRFAAAELRTVRRPLRLFSVELPLTVVTEQRREVCAMRGRLTPETLPLAAARRARELAARQWPDAEVLSVETGAVPAEGGWQITARLLAELPVARFVPAEEENGKGQSAGP